MLVQIKLTALGSNSAIGSFSPGDTARLPVAFARHLVEEARVAKYMEAPAPVAEVQTQPRKRKGK